MRENYEVVLFNGDEVVHREICDIEGVAVWRMIAEARGYTIRVEKTSEEIIELKTVRVWRRNDQIK